MKAEWKEYLSSVGIEGTLLDRVETVLSFYQRICPDRTEDIFVAEYLDKEGNREYESLWMFSDTLVMEAKRFLNEDDFDCLPMERHLSYWTVKKTQYDCTHASADSRMFVEFRSYSGVHGSLKASRGNCDHLMRLFLKYIVPNTVTYASLARQSCAAEDVE